MGSSVLHLSVGDPSLTEWISATSSAVTAVGVVAGGLWAAYLFGIRRTARPKIDLDIQIVETRSLGQTVSFHLRVSAVNSGSIGLKKTYGVFQLKMGRQRPAPSGSRLNGPFGGGDQSYEVFVSHSYLEPGEVFAEDILLTLQEAPYVEFRVILHGAKPYHSWTNHRIFWSDALDERSVCEAHNQVDQASAGPGHKRAARVAKDPE